MKDRHLKNVETARALAALAVAIYHFSAYYTWSEQTSINLTYGAQGVEVFYLISGFIIPYSLYHSSYKIRYYFKYMLKRLIRLMPPFILSIILIQIIKILLCEYVWGCIHDVNFRQIAINILFLADYFPNYDWLNAVFPTLEVELQFYIIIGLLFGLYRKWAWTLPLASVLLIGIGIISRDFDTFFINSPYFIIGTSAFFIKEHGWKWEYSFALAIAFITLTTEYFWEDLIAAVIGFSFIYFVPSNIRFLNLTGKISYSFYLLHGLCGGWYLHFVAPSEFGQKYVMLNIVLALVMSWILSFLIYISIEKISIKLSKRIKYSK